MEACITGIGWVLKDSMGYTTRVHKFVPEKGLPHIKRKIKRKDVIDQAYKPFGRMDDFSKQGFAAISFALNDAGIKKGTAKKTINMVASTATGCLETDIRYWKTLADNVPSPAVFAYTLDSCFLSEISIYFGLTGESFVINEENTNGLTGLYFAIEMIHSGESDTVLCGICNSDIQFAQPNVFKIIPGSLFFVIEKDSDQSYGRITTVSPEIIYDENKIEITDLYDLAKKIAKGKK